MSVINKMLRDLDSRQTGHPTPAQTSDARTSLMRDTLSVKGSNSTERQARSLSRLLQGITAVLTLVGVAAWWYLNQTAAPQRPVQAVQPAASTKPESVATPVPSPAPLLAVPLAVVPPQQLAAPVTAPEMPALAPRAETVKLPVPKSGAANIDFSLRMDSLLRHAPSLGSAALSQAADAARSAPKQTVNPSAPSEAHRVLTAPTATTALTAPPGQTRPAPAQEALAQAQALWNAGSRSEAIDLLHEALALAERANPANSPSGSNSVVASFARELARMELAEGRVNQVLALLTRLEPMLSGFADIWALRGNAAQRLGQHPASAAAYLMALKLRPNEPRWMLGAAVSLAAQGQTAAAAELAEKARGGGALTPEVASYLRQLGVSLRE